MASRTQLVCLCEGDKDKVFINRLVRSLNPSWIRKQGGNWIRILPCGGRTSLLKEFPNELRNCLAQGSSTTLMVWADCDHDHADPSALLETFRQAAQESEIGQDDFEQTVFVFAKDRLENGMQFLQDGTTDESEEGPRVNDSEATQAAKKLAELCGSGRPMEDFPPSLAWSCNNWRSLSDRMKRA